MAVPIRHAFLPALLLYAATLPAGAGDGKAAARLDPRLELRLRHEQVEDAGFAHRAVADTLRLRVGLDLQWDDRWQALVEAEGVAAADGRHDSGANGRGAFPAVIDPAGIELNQAWLSWSDARFAWTLGRQRLQLDNQRWIGNSGWRQNEQTFDAAALSWNAPGGAILRVLWLDRVHRVAGDHARNPLARERDLDTWLFNAAFPQDAGQWVAYGYRHRDIDLPTASTLTAGLRSTGRRARDWGGWGWTLEAAAQRDSAGNPLRFVHRYWLIEPSLTAGGITWRLGWEHLGGDGSNAMQAPLGTLHAFNGWADRFNTTPATGLEDRYLAAGGELDGGRAWSLVWHDYRADHGGQSLGREWNASLGFPLHGRLKGLVKYADFQGRGGMHDVRKAWLQLEWSSP